MLAAFEPIWMLTVLGYLVRRSALLGAGSASVLGRFVFHLAMPADLFLTLARTPLSGFTIRPLVAFGASTALVIGGGWFAAGRVFRHRPGDRVIWGMAAGYVNSANLGIPIALQVLGSLSFLVEIVLMQGLIVTPIILVSLDRYADPAGRIRLRRIATLPGRNPIILGSALGVIWSLFGLPVPSIAAIPLRLLAAAAVPVALIALGASLHREREAATPKLSADVHLAIDGVAGLGAVDTSATALAAGAGVAAGGVAVAATRRAVARAGAGEIGLIAGLKLVAQPVLAWLAALLLRLPDAQVLAVVVCAGLPTAQNTFIFAQEYGVGEDVAGRAVVVSTALSLATLAGIAGLLGK
jgi:malonate transporter and related proteins